MPLLMETDKNPSRSAKKHGHLSVETIEHSSVPSEGLRIALINNMADSALEDTEEQFFGLLGSAAGDLPVRVGLYSLPQIRRGDRAKQHLSRSYLPWRSLSNSPVDGVIVTGAEPRMPDLRDEPYWRELCELFEWAEVNTDSAVLSCLAAHAGVLHGDGIPRCAQKEKQFGIFAQRIIGEHPLTRGVREPVRIPHSRWNGLEQAELEARGYSVLTHSDEAGVDTFVKRRGRSLFVHFQGHPEYGPQTLLKEYRRDISRYLRGEREAYPSMPRGYFDERSAKLLSDFEAHVASKRRDEGLSSFPQAAIASSLEHSWHGAAVRIYRNWLEYLIVRKADRVKAAAPISVRQAAQCCATNAAPGPISTKKSSAAFPHDSASARS